MERRLKVVATVVNAAVAAGATRHVAAAITATAMRVALEQEPGEEDGEIAGRLDTIREATLAHSTLNEMNGTPAHCLGTATAQAAPLLTRQEKKVLQALRRKANGAKHTWPCGVQSLCEASKHDGDPKQKKKQDQQESNEQNETASTTESDDTNDSATTQRVLARSPGVAYVSPAPGTREQNVQTEAPFQEQPKRQAEVEEQAVQTLGTPAPVTWFPLLVPSDVIAAMQQHSSPAHGSVPAVSSTILQCAQEYMEVPVPSETQAHAQESQSKEPRRTMPQREASRRRQRHLPQIDWMRKSCANLHWSKKWRSVEQSTTDLPRNWMHLHARPVS